MNLMKRPVSVLLLFAVMLSVFAGFAVSAEESAATASTEATGANYKDIVNLYEMQGLGIPTGAANAAFDSTTSYASSHLIPVQEGDVIYVGLVNLSQKWHIATYAADGTKKTNVAKGDAAGDYTSVVHQDLDGSLGILKWTVPAGVAQIRLTTNALKQDVLLTKNQPFDYETMLKVMPLRNYYNFLGANLLPGNTADATTEISGWYTSELVEVVPGDVIYFGPAQLNQGWHFRGYDASGANKASLERNKETMIIDSKYVYSQKDSSTGILKWTVPDNVTQIRFTTQIKDNPVIVTRNQPFTVDIWSKITTGSDAELAYATYAENLLSHPIVFKNEYVSAGEGLPGSTKDVITEYSGFTLCEPIAVTPGDVLYIGMADPTQGWHLKAYKQDGTQGTGDLTKDLINANPEQYIHDSISGTRAVLKWTVPADIAYVRFTTWVTDYPMLVTKNKPFDVDFYRAAMLPNNQYQPARNDSPNVSDINAFVANNGYISSEPIEVKAGDKLYFGPCPTSQGWFLAPYTGTGTKGGDSVSASNAATYATISNTESILCYTVPMGVTHVRMTVLSKYCQTAVLTVNQPFDKISYNRYITDLAASNYGYGNEIEASPLNNMSALFLGDSITYGSYDKMNPTQGRSWAGRFAATTGLKINNAGVGGSTVAKLEGKGWIFDKYTENKGNSYDMVVMGGGVNDARNKLAIGEILDIDDAATLEASVDLTTFAGGMQWLFYNVRNTWKDAKLFYIANFRLGDPTGYAQDMSAYFAVAKQLCERYDVTYIDLYNNTELNMLLQPTNTRYMPDLLHPTSRGYDIIFPYIREAVESEIMTSLLKVQVNIAPTNDLRFLTTVDTLNYASVGFEITRGTDGKTATVTTTTVYTSVSVSLLGSERKTFAQDVSGYALSEYIACVIVEGVPAGMTLTIRAFVTHKDGTIVYGDQKQVTVPNN